MSLSLTVIRVGMGFTMLMGHGLPKYLKFNTIAPFFPDPIGLGSTVSLVLAIFAELFCSILLILGIGVRFAVIPLLITMLVAIIVVHSGDPFAKRELAILYTMGYTSLLIGGRGCYAVKIDRLLPKKPWINWLLGKEKQC